MAKKIKKIILFFGIIFVFLLNAGFVLALEVPLPGLGNKPDIGAYVCYIVGLGMSLAVIIAALSVAFGGIYYLVSYGRGKFTSEAKEWIKAGITGLLIVVCAPLIAYTINPDLTSCKIGVLSPLSAINSSINPATSKSTVPVFTYQEIPIGTLTENLLTRTMDCYGFDQEGNPVAGEKITAGNCGFFGGCPEGQTCDKNSGKCYISGPTYIDHDRADCLTQLVEGAQKKASVIAALSDEITKLMDSCDCEKFGKCKDTCGGENGCFIYGSNVKFGTDGQCTGTCAGPCIGAGCEQPAEPPDCCPPGVKNQIEHGLILLSVDVGSSSGVGGVCLTPQKGYKGLDEFRCPNPNDGKIQTPCSGIPGWVEKQIRIDNKTIIVIDQSKWKLLNLIQQETYFKEKIANWAKDSKIQADKNELERAKSTLNNCYMAMPYLDLIKARETADNTQRLVSINPETFYDTATSKPISVSKYCAGFNYDNSDCLKMCNDMCPDTSDKAVGLYQQKTGKCAKDDTVCLDKAAKEAYQERPCPDAPDPSNTKTFAGCLTACQGGKASDCEKKYLACSNEYDFCEEQSANNSQCVIDKADVCLFGGQGLKNCVTSTTDQGNTNFCINNAYLCKNGSNEYAGYPDCATPGPSKCSAGDSSASFFYENPKCQKCKDPYASLTKGGGKCQDIYPETAKCPTSSNCPGCPCDQIDTTLKFSVPIESYQKVAYEDNYYTTEQPFSAYQMVGPQCNNYSLNDDPLTFYCQDNWWLDPNREKSGVTPIGTEKVCPIKLEIPIGQTVDNAKNWADALIKSADKINQDIQVALNQMDKIGKAKDTSPIQDYCRCNAKFENSNPICKTDCQYAQWWDIVGADQDGNPIWGWRCSCILEPCKGSPCQQMTDYLAQLWNNIRQLKLDFIDFYTAMLKEPRSDIMKELTYSRQTTNNCSVTSSSSDSKNRLLNCTRVEDELISPITTGQITINGETVNSYCYGKELGKLFDTPLTDNWFCCQQYQKTPGTQGATAQ